MVATAQQKSLLKVSTICRCFRGTSSRETEGSALPENFLEKMLGFFFGLNFIAYFFVKKFVFN